MSTTVNWKQKYEELREEMAGFERSNQSLRRQIKDLQEEFNLLRKPSGSSGSKFLSAIGLAIKTNDAEAIEILHQCWEAYEKNFRPHRIHAALRLEGEAGK